MGGYFMAMMALMLGSGMETPDSRNVPTTITVRVLNYARVPADTLRAAKERVSQNFGKIGIELRWLELTEPPVTEIRTSSAVELNVVIVAQAPVAFNKNDHTMGVAASSSMAQVFYDRVEKPARAFAQTTAFPYPVKAVILSHAISHELGHLLGLPHSSTGIMRAALDSDDYLQAATGSLVFTETDSDRIRAEFSRRAPVRVSLQLPQ